MEVQKVDCKNLRVIRQKENNDIMRHASSITEW